MGFFRRADDAEVRRVETPDGEDYVELYGEFSKKKVNQIVSSAPRDGSDLGATMAFVERFFELAVANWSMTDADGAPVPPTVEAYNALSAEPAAWLDKVLIEHLGATIGKQVEDLEGKASN